MNKDLFEFLKTKKHSRACASEDEMKYEYRIGKFWCRLFGHKWRLPNEWFFQNSNVTCIYYCERCLITIEKLGRTYGRTIPQRSFMSELTDRLLEVAGYVEKAHPEPCVWAFIIRRGTEELLKVEAAQQSVPADVALCPVCQEPRPVVVMCEQCGTP